MEKRMEVGIDTCKFEVIMQNGHVTTTNKVFKNSYGIEYAKLETKGQKVYFILNLPKVIRNDNVEPFNKDDFKCINGISNNINELIQKELNTSHFTTKLVTIEVNQTNMVEPSATCHNILDLLSCAMLDKKKQIHLYATDNNTLRPSIDGLETYQVKHKFVMKCYNKGKKEGILTKRELLRIEFILQDRLINSIIGKKRTLEDVLTGEVLQKFICVYGDIFKEIIEEFVKPYLLRVEKKILEEIKLTHKPSFVYWHNKEIIFDEVIFARALKTYQEEENKSVNPSQTLCRFRETHNMPCNTLKTIKRFREYL
jgi:hypothetical protein